MKSAIWCAVVTAVFVSSAFASDERPLPGSPAVVAKTSAAENREQPAVPAVDAPATSASLVAPVSPALPSAPSAIVLIKRQPETHRFFDVKNSLALSAVGASLTADALSTQKGLSYPGFYEMNPVARPFVQTRAGASVYSVGSLGLIAAGMYVAHRTNHHKLERIFPFAIAGWEGLLSARNYHVIAQNTK